MAAHNELGKEGEDAACAYLEREGYVIVERNWRYHRFEIDIIAECKDYIVFVEVKTRANEHWGNPEDFITKGQIKRIVAAADFYLQEYNIDKDARFDVFAIVKRNGKLELEYFDDAFMAPIN